VLARSGFGSRRAALLPVAIALLLLTHHAQLWHLIALQVVRGQTAGVMIASAVATYQIPAVGQI